MISLWFFWCAQEAPELTFELFYICRSAIIRNSTDATIYLSHAFYV